MKKCYLLMQFVVLVISCVVRCCANFLTIFSLNKQNIVLPCGKKNPDNQYDLGRPWIIQLLIKAHLKTRSFTQLPRGFRDG